jgi:sec-independent protein translocase protein TatB
MAGSGLTGFLQNFGGGEILLIVLAALVVLGPERLPDAARSIGKGIHRLRTMTSGMQSQVQDVIDDPAMQSIRELGEFAARPRQKLAEYALEAEAEARSLAEQAERTAAAESGATSGDAAPGSTVDETPDSTSGDAAPGSTVDETPDSAVDETPDSTVDVTPEVPAASRSSEGAAAEGAASTAVEPGAG